MMKLQLMDLDQAPTSTFALAVLSARNGISDILANISMPHSVIFQNFTHFIKEPFLVKVFKTFI